MRSISGHELCKTRDCADPGCLNEADHGSPWCRECARRPRPVLLNLTRTERSTLALIGVGCDRPGTIAGEDGRAVAAVAMTLTSLVRKGAAQRLERGRYRVTPAGAATLNQRDAA